MVLEDGQVTFLVKMCEGTSLVEFQIVELGFGNIDGRESWWRIEGRATSEVIEIDAWSVPNGFLESHRNERDVLADDWLVIRFVRLAGSTDVPGGESWRVADLEGDRGVYFDGRYHTREEFARIRCDF